MAWRARWRWRRGSNKGKDGGRRCAAIARFPRIPRIGRGDELLRPEDLEGMTLPGEVAPIPPMIGSDGEHERIKDDAGALRSSHGEEDGDEESALVPSLGTRCGCRRGASTRSMRTYALPAPQAKPGTTSRKRGGSDWWQARTLPEDGVDRTAAHAPAVPAFPVRGRTAASTARALRALSRAARRSGRPFEGMATFRTLDAEQRRLLRQRFQQLSPRQRARLLDRYRDATPSSANVPSAPKPERSGGGRNALASAGPAFPQLGEAV